MKPRHRVPVVPGEGNLDENQAGVRERSAVGTREWILTIGVIVVPLAIAVIVTLWSLEQARYRPKRKRAPGIRRDEPVDAQPGPSTDSESRPRQDPSQPTT